MKHTLLFVLSVFTSFYATAQLPSWLPANGLVAWYPFNGNANDGSGHNYNGTVNGATIAADRFSNPNSAYTFNGSSGNIEVSSNSALRLSGTDFTISTWIYNSATATVNLNAILSKRAASLGSGYMLGIIGLPLTDPNKIQYQVSGGTDPKAISADTIALNTWMNLMITYNHTAEVLNIYFDGVLNATVSNIPEPSATSTAPLWIGNDAGGQPYCFNGSIDDIAIYNRILSSCERNELINQSGITITTQPASANYAIGDTVTFIVASSDSCLSYQWQRDCGSGYVSLTNGSFFQGVTNDSLTINGVVSALNNCKFRCVVSSCLWCADTSAEATLNTTAAINQLDMDNTISISPSPANDYINVHLTPHKYSALTIYNALGKIVYNLPVITDSEVNVNIASFPKGLYLLTAHSFSNDSQVVRFIKN